MLDTLAGTWLRCPHIDHEFGKQMVNTNVQGGF
jgi:hypothetical protein